MSLVREDASLPPDVPQLEVCVCAARGQEVPVGVEVDGGEAGLMPGQGAHQFGGLQVPDLERARLGPGADQLLCVAEADALHGGRVAAEGLEREIKEENKH